MTGPALQFDHYDWAGGREAMLRVGPAGALMVVFAPALFEEANRTRAFTLAIMHALASRGFGSALPDLPGQGDSPLPTEKATLTAWREAFAAVVRVIAPISVVALRGGAMVVGSGPPCWQLAPVDGETTIRDLRRLALAGGGMLDGEPDPVEIGGNRLSRRLLADIDGATIEPASRIVRLESDRHPADRKVPGVPLWRMAEPGNDLPLVSVLADDIADWISACASN